MYVFQPINKVFGHLFYILKCSEHNFLLPTWSCCGTVEHMYYPDSLTITAAAYNKRHTGRLHFPDILQIKISICLAAYNDSLFVVLINYDK